MKKNTLLTTTNTHDLEKLWATVFHEGVKLEKCKGHILKESSVGESRLYFLQKGEVSLVTISEEGKERLLGKSQGPALLCEENIFSENNRLDSSIILNTPCTLYAFSKTWVHTKLLPHHPDLTLSLLQSFAAKTLKLINQRIFLRSDSIRALICNFLQQYVLKDEGEVYARPRLSQVELANFLGVHPVSLNKSLKKLQSDGILGKYHKEKTCILDYERFVCIVGSKL